MTGGIYFMLRKIQKAAAVFAVIAMVMGSVTAFGASFKETLREAQNGDAEAQYNLGLMYYNGYGVRQDKSEAVNWYRKAAEQGHASAQFNLGLMYGKGEGVKQDYTEAVNWLRKAARQGDTDAQELLKELGETW